MTECRKGHQNFDISAVLPVGTNSKARRKVRSLLTDLQWELDQQVPLVPLRCFFCQPTFYRDVGALRCEFHHTNETALKSVWIFTFFFTWFLLIFFSELSFPRKFSAGKAMWKQEHLSNLDGQMDWICHKSDIVFFPKMEGMEFSKTQDF